MRAVWRKVMREKSKRDREKRVAVSSTYRRLRSVDEAIGVKSTWLALFSLIPGNYLRSTSLASGAQGTAGATGNTKSDYCGAASDHWHSDYVSPMHQQFYFPSEGTLEGKILIVVSETQLPEPPSLNVTVSLSFRPPTLANWPLILSYPP